VDRTSRDELSSSWLEEVHDRFNPAEMLHPFTAGGVELTEGDGFPQRSQRSQRALGLDVRSYRDVALPEEDVKLALRSDAASSSSSLGN